MGMMVPVFVGSVDQSILATSLPTIGRALGDVHDLPWLITAYLIAATALTPLYGKFADIRGRRASLLIALGVYMTGALISASSSTMLMLICGRVVQGCGGGGLISTAQMVLGDIAAPKDRGKYYAYFSIAFTSAAACGPALGGWICDHLHWWVIFLWNLPLAVVAVILALTVLRRLPRYDRPHQLDFIGAILVMAASSSFMLALNLGGVRYPWLSAPVIGLLAGALLLGAAFVVRLLTAAEPLIPDCHSVRSGGAGGDSGQLFRLGRAHRPQRLSADVSAERARLVGDSIRTERHRPDGHLQRQRRAFQPAHRPGEALQDRCRTSVFVIGVAALLALAYSADSMTPVKFEIILFLIGVGLGPTAPLTQVVLQNTVATHHLGAAIGTMNFTRVLGGTILVAVFGAVVLVGRGRHPRPGPAAMGCLGPRSKPSPRYSSRAAGTLMIAFLAMLMLEEKPLQATMPAARA